jgi:UDP-2,3-diacylglucosamine pyrophosphatase LpxH
MGHRHRIIYEKIAGGYYINLGEWIKDPQVGIFDGNEFKLIPVLEYLSK